MDVSLVAGSSRDHRHRRSCCWQRLSRRLNSENETSFLSDILLLLRVRVTVCLGIVFRVVVVGRPVRVPRLLYTNLPPSLAALLVPWGTATEFAAQERHAPLFPTMHPVQLPPLCAPSIAPSFPSVTH
ncbi:hypothetical protein LEMLEM_LOCUS9268 [Lemmus lemmus]